jgi:hypothetical protein
MAGGFLAGPLTTQVTDPGQAYNIGSAEDLRNAQAILGQGLAKAQGTASSGAILGSMFGSIGSTLGDMDFGQPSSMTSSPVTFGGQSPRTSGVNPSSFGNFECNNQLHLEDTHFHNYA